MSELLPPELVERLEALQKAGTTGKAELHYKDGDLLAWDIHESHRRKAPAPIRLRNVAP